MGNSVCVTTQVGCRIGCTFCASTLGGLKRNLEAGEIVSQVVKVQQALDETDERVNLLLLWELVSLLITMTNDVFLKNY